MKNVLLLLALTLTINFTNAQVAIGTTSPNPSSVLDLTSSNRGLLIPRIELKSTNDIITIPSPATSLLIYNTTTNTDLTTGFYYWDQKWITLKSATTTNGASSGWSQSGNTAGDSDYFGTNNYAPLVFKVNNVQFSSYKPLGGLAIGNGADANENRSIAIGSNSNALPSIEAIAIGVNSQGLGYQSVAIGVLSKATNNSAIALGNSSEATGEQSTAIGTFAKSSGQNATAIGYRAQATEANTIILGNAEDVKSKIGIGTSTPKEKLHIKGGSICIEDGTQAAGNVLSSDANGKASWQDLNDLKVYGEIYRTSDKQLAQGAINFNASGVSFNSTLSDTNIQVKKKGLYKVTYTVSLKKESVAILNCEFYLGLYGTEIPGTRTFITIGNLETRSVSLTKLVNLEAYNAVGVYSSTSDASTKLLANGCTLSIELIK